MKKVPVEICVCTACVMSGSVEIMEAVESLRDLREEMSEGYPTKHQGEIELSTNKCLGNHPHQKSSPVVSIDGKVFERADAESVMATIVEIFQQSGEQ